MSRPAGSRESTDPAARLAFVLDRVFRVPGTEWRFGLDPVLGLVFPIGGDLLGGVVAAYLVLAAVRAGVPRLAVARMVFNIVVDVALGSVPVVGDLFDAAWKANERNLAVLRRYAGSRGRAADWRDRAWAAALLGVLALALLGGAVATVAALRALGVRLV